MHNELSQQRFTFSRHSRLTQPGEFRRVFAKNVSASDRNFVVLARPNDKTMARLGLAVAKKHIKRASGRNIVKRIVRESFRMHQHEIGCIDVVVLVKRGIDVGNKPLLKQGLDLLWQKLRKQCESSQHC